VGSRHLNAKKEEEYREHVGKFGKVFKNGNLDAQAAAVGSWVLEIPGVGQNFFLRAGYKQWDQEV